MRPSTHLTVTTFSPLGIDAMRAAPGQVDYRRARVLANGTAVVIQRGTIEPGRTYCIRCVIPAASVGNLIGS